MSDYAGYLAALTSVYPFFGDGYIDTGDYHSLGIPEVPNNCIGVLAGFDVWFQPPIAGTGQVYLENNTSTYAFWAGVWSDGSLVPAGGGYAQYRGGYLFNNEADIYVGAIRQEGVSPDINYAYWGYFIPAGWSPVGLPPQQ